MVEYKLTSVWHLDAPIDKVWPIIEDATVWPQWWPSWRKVVATPAGPITEHTVLACKVRGWLPYSLSFELHFTKVQQPNLTEYRCAGDLQGHGACKIATENEKTRVEFIWDVGTTEWLFNLLGKLCLVKWIIRNNHTYVMNQGLKGIEALLAKEKSA